jgi:hypothetical protein
MSFTLYRPACSCGWRSRFLALNHAEAKRFSEQHVDVYYYEGEHLPLVEPEQHPSDES